MTRHLPKSALAAAAAGALTITACGGESNGDGDAPLSFAHVLAESQPWHQCGALTFEESIQDSETGIDLDLYPAAQTHNDTLEQLDAIDSGNLDITWATPAQLATRMSTLEVFDAAYLFDGPEHMTDAVQSEPAEELWEELREEHGMRVIGTGYYGTRHLTSDNEVAIPSDMSGQQLRVLDAPLWLDNGAALGADPTAVAFSELYLALQQGVIDAQENPLPVIEAEGFDEVQNYVHLTEHVVAMMAVVISEDTWETLDEDQQDAVMEAGEALGEGVTECTLQEEEELLEEWSGGNSDIVVNDDVDLDAFRENAEDILFPKYEDEWGETYRDLQDQQ